MVVCFLVDIFILTVGLSENDIASAGRESHLGGACVGGTVGESHSYCSGSTFTLTLAVLTCERISFFLIFVTYN